MHQFIPIKIMESHKYELSFVFPHFSTANSKLYTDHPFSYLRRTIIYNKFWQ